MLPLHGKIWLKDYHDFQIKNDFVFYLNGERIHFQQHSLEKKEAESIFLNKKLEVEVVQMAHFLPSYVFDTAFFVDCELKKNASELLVDLQAHSVVQL